MKRKSGMGFYQMPIEASSTEWYTPPALIAALGKFDDDPCVPGRKDGLRRAWHGRVWLNPPYGRIETGLWLSRLADHGNGIALIFARTETEFFFREVWARATACLFLKGRVNFIDGSGRPTKKNSHAGAPSVLVAYGSNNAQALVDSQMAGFFMFTRKPSGWIIGE